MSKEVFLAGSVRTPFGAFNGALASLTAPQLGSLAVRASLERAGVKPQDVDEVIYGNVIAAGIGQNVARQVSLGAGIGNEVGCTTVNKVCGSGLRAVELASQAIRCGDAGLVAVGGCESMTNAPYLLPKARSGYRMGHGQLVDSLIHDGLWDVYNDKHMGTCGDACAAKYNITREEQDDFAIESYKRAGDAWESGFLSGEVIPVEIRSRKGSVMVERDEGVTSFRGADKARALRPAFGKDGTVTAGNASSLSDGAAALVAFGAEKRDALGIKPAARILGFANHAMEPEWFSIAPIHAIRKLTEKLSLSMGDVDLFEINEAFAVVAVAAIKELGLDSEKVNIAGGAVAIGHPLGATGARILNTLTHALHHHDRRIGIACLCIGGGEALAVAIERCD